MKAYLGISGTIFGVVALVHAFRLAYGWPAQIGTWSVPLWISWAGLLAPGALSVWAFWLIGAGQTKP